MLVTMTRNEFESFEPRALIWACIEPTIGQVKAKSFEVKAQVSAQLSARQQALLMFQIMYGHTQFQQGLEAIGIAELFGVIPYLPGQSRIWSSLKSSMRYFGDDAMLKLLEQMESHYFEADAEWHVADIDRKFQKPISQLDALFHDVMPAALLSM